MNSDIVNLLNSKIDKVDHKVDGLGEKIDELLEFKWQIVGSTMATSFIIGVIIQVGLFIFGKK